MLKFDSMLSLNSCGGGRASARTLTTKHGRFDIMPITLKVCVGSGGMAMLYADRKDERYEK